MIINNSSLFFSILNLILININIIDTKKAHVNLHLHIHPGGKGKERGEIVIKIVISKGVKYL
jgi:hypothetical protein